MNMFTKEKLKNIFADFRRMKILIIGDVMVDSYLWGRVERISPEAPVPVVSLIRRENRPGGAANVALNVQSLGAEAILCSVIGNDLHGDQFLGLLQEHGLRSEGMIADAGRVTTTKFRIIGNNSHLLRVDEETDSPVGDALTGQMLQRIKTLLDQGLDAVIFEDYDKGVITEKLITEVVKIAQQKSIPVAVDPKKRNFASYRNVSLFKPNLKELREGLKTDLQAEQESLDRVLIPWLQQQEMQMLMVTLSEAGIYMLYRNADCTARSLILPAHLRKIADVSGAGDSVIAVSALGLALDLEAEQIAALANLAGGLVCEEVGVVPVNKDRLFEEALLKLCQNG